MLFTQVRDWLRFGSWGGGREGRAAHTRWGSLEAEGAVGLGGRKVGLASHLPPAG